MALRALLSGFVLKKYMLLEMTQSVTVFTRESGKMHFIMRGAQQVTSRRSAHVQTGNLITIHASAHASGAWYMGTTELVSGFSALKESSEKVRILYNVCMVLDRLLPLGQAEQSVFDRLTRSLINLNDTYMEYDQVFFTFFADIFAELGYGSTQVTTYDDVHDIVRSLTNEKMRFLI